MFCTRWADLQHWWRFKYRVSSSEYINTTPIIIFTRFGLDVFHERTKFLSRLHAKLADRCSLSAWSLSVCVDGVKTEMWFRWHKNGSSLAKIHAMNVFLRGKDIWYYGRRVVLHPNILLSILSIRPTHKKWPHVIHYLHGVRSIIDTTKGKWNEVNGVLGYLCAHIG